MLGALEDAHHLGAIQSFGRHARDEPIDIGTSGKVTASDAAASRSARRSSVISSPSIIDGAERGLAHTGK
jgi:hypothetical protein